MYNKQEIVYNPKKNYDSIICDNIGINIEITYNT